MQEYKTLKIENIYNIDDINKALPLLNSSGIDTLTDKTNIILNFDTVDIKLLENIKYNPLIQKTIEELYKIRSFSSSNGKIVFKSFNKEKRVKNKKENSKKRLAYEYYKKDFSKTNNELNKKFINKIHCADSLDIIKKFPDNCIDIVLTSPPYNFGIIPNKIVELMAEL
ncbi:site-specific DNA-methyltransferase [Brachyspira aalborgi]|uniref:site-specific DNA-methyltransferase (cytosine-N(4)-specific) n=1 Tax=Brachyspira aalborgi TaxID=29522 RepID=A0A5C8E0H4_9SPIR|nr:site-specific DNA-methyltransferase [Brachyspira aalborgi]TXJ30834.1 site-specific DNA-methyltransferase [Brachyspira aalborgi]